MPKGGGPVCAGPQRRGGAHGKGRYGGCSKMVRRLYGADIDGKGGVGRCTWLVIEGWGRITAVKRFGICAFPATGDRYIFRENGGHFQFTLQSAGMADRVFEKVKRVKIPVAGLGEYMGAFYSKELDASYVLFVKDSVLMVKTPRNEAMGMQAYIRDVFVGPFTVEFLRDRRGKVTGFLVTTGRSRGIRFEKKGSR